MNFEEWFDTNADDDSDYRLTRAAWDAAQRETAKRCIEILTELDEAQLYSVLKIRKEFLK